MTEHPIPFTGDMVRAILERRKTQTRRIIRLTKDGRDFRSPYRVPGDHLWVREAHVIIKGNTMHRKTLDEALIKGPSKDLVFYPATDRIFLGEKKRPPMFMPRWASRITLVNEGERIERVQEISAEDAKAEGVMDWWHNSVCPLPDERPAQDLECGTMQAHFACLWDSINAKRGYGWEKNPRVRVVTFRLLEVKA